MEQPHSTLIFKRLYHAFFISVILSAPATAQETRTIDLQTAIQTTLSNNLQIKQAQFQEAITDETLKQSRFELLPSVSGSASANRRFGLFFDQTTGRLVNDADGVNGNLSSSVTIFQGGQLRNQILQNKQNLQADKSNVEKVKNDLSLTVVTTYLQALTNADFIKASEQQLALSKSQLDVASKNFGVGNNTAADLSQAKAQVANNELSLTNARNAYEISLLELKQLMNMAPEEPIQLVYPKPVSIDSLNTVYSGNEVFRQAVVDYPDIQVARYNTAAAETGIKIARGALYPSLSFGGGFGTSYSNIAPTAFWDQIDNNISKSIGFSLNVPIFNNLRSRTNLSISKIRYENAKVTEQLAKNNLNKVINQAMLDLRSANSRYGATQTAYEASKDAFEAMQKRYDVGLANSIELNTAQTNFNKAEFDFIQAKYDLIFRSKVIDFYLGNPINL